MTLRHNAKSARFKQASCEIVADCSIADEKILEHHGYVDRGLL